MFMPAPFDLLIPRRVVYGWGRREELGTLAASLGRRVLLIDGSRTLRRSLEWTALIETLEKSGLKVESVASASAEPSIQDVDEATEIVRQLSPGPGDLVLAIGGGSALDLGKAVAAMAMNGNGRSVREFLEGIGTGAVIEHDPLPVLAVPTTAGTGSEATKNAVISCPDPACKKSLRSERMVPAIVLLDPELTVSVPAAQTASSGMDAITQLLESLVTRKAQPATDALCIAGLKLSLGTLNTAYHHPDDRVARESMCLAAFYSGVALTNSGLGLAHGVAAALGAICEIPHGLACAVMLPATLKVNVSVLKDKLKSLSPLLSTDPGWKDIPPDALAEHVIEAVETLCRELQIPSRLRDVGVLQSQLPQIAAGSQGNSLSGNPVTLSPGQLTALLEELW
jgi:alcohol dehydrogenase class IV